MPPVEPEYPPEDSISRETSALGHLHRPLGRVNARSRSLEAIEQTLLKEVRFSSAIHRALEGLRVA